MFLVKSGEWLVTTFFSASTAEDDPFTFGNRLFLELVFVFLKLLWAFLALVWSASMFSELFVLFFFPADYHRLRVGGLILAAVLCLIGIMILLSKLDARAQTCPCTCEGFKLFSSTKNKLNSSFHLRWTMQVQVQPEQEVIFYTFKW